MKAIVKLISLSKEVIDFLEQGNLIVTKKAKYYRYPFWLKSTPVENVYEILGIEEPMEIQRPVKVECKMLYDQIKKAETRLEEIRTNCKHPEVYIGNYSWRIGTMSPAHICIECGQMLGYLTEEEILNHPHKQLDLFNEKEKEL